MHITTRLLSDKVHVHKLFVMKVLCSYIYKLHKSHSLLFMYSTRCRENKTFLPQQKTIDFSNEILFSMINIWSTVKQKLETVDQYTVLPQPAENTRLSGLCQRLFSLVTLANDVGGPYIANLHWCIARRIDLHVGDADGRGKGDARTGKKSN